RIRGAHAAPLARRQPGEGEQSFACFLEAVGDGAVLEAPFADEGLATGLDFLPRGRIDHVVVIRCDLVMKALGRMCQQVPVLVNRAALNWHAVPDGGDGLVEPGRTIDDE